MKYSNKKKPPKYGDNLNFTAIKNCSYQIFIIRIYITINLYRHIKA